MGRGTVWTGAEMNYLKKTLELDDEYISRHLNRSLYAIKSMRYKLKRGYEATDEEYAEPGKLMSRSEKITRIYKMAADMHIRLAK